MATIKSYTDIDQSKKLAEILPLESADMYLWSSGKRYYIEAMDDGDFNEEEGHVRAWSLAALLEFLRNRSDCNYVTLTSNKASLWCLRTSYYNHVWEDAEEVSENAVDACVDMILKLNELNLL